MMKLMLTFVFSLFFSIFTLPVFASNSNIFSITFKNNCLKDTVQFYIPQPFLSKSCRVYEQSDCTAPQCEINPASPNLVLPPHGEKSVYFAKESKNGSFCHYQVNRSDLHMGQAVFSVKDELKLITCSHPDNSLSCVCDNIHEY